MTVVALIPGPDGHGVVRHGRTLAAAAGVVEVRVGDVPRGATVVLELTDRLLGPTVAGAATELERLLGQLADAGCLLVASLHDVPGPDDWSPQRQALYRRVIAASAGVLVCSGLDAERAQLLGAARVVVAPIPVADRMAPAPACAAASVTVAGYVWPGKGHDEVLAAMAGLPADVPLIVAGEAAAGHQDVLAGLTGRPVHVSGRTDELAFTALLRAPTVPVAPNRAVSASASIAAWWAAGRRPLVPRVSYTCELATRDPGALWLYDELAPVLREAFAKPADTWLAAGARPGWDVSAVARVRMQAVAAWQR
jgi:hypothetical protein